MLVLGRRLWASLVFDELPLLAQPLALGRLRIAHVVFGSSPSKCDRAGLDVGVDTQFSCAGRRCDPAALASAMAVPDHKETRRVPTAAVIAAQSFVNVALGKIQTPLFDLNRRVRQLRVGPQQAAKVGAADAQFAGGPPSKLARALRAMAAARRKTLRRIRETIRTEYRDRTTFIHVPVDHATGRVIDPDGTLGQPAGGSRP